MSDNEQKPFNRSSALSPEMMALVTEQSSALTREIVAEAVKSAVAGAFAQLGPIIQNLNKPYEDPVKKARLDRELAEWKEQEQERQKNERAAKDRCTHLDERGQYSVGLIRNYFDRQVRGVCMHCHDLIHPKEWRIAPTKEAAIAEGNRLGTEVNGRAYIYPAHKDYVRIVMSLAAKE